MSPSYQQHGYGFSFAIGAAGLATSIVAASLWRLAQQNQQKHQRRDLSSSVDKARCSAPTDTAGTCYEALIGNTPMVHLSILSALIQRDIYVKMESLNPGGTGKDRAALGMIRAAEESGGLPPPDYSMAARRADTDTGVRISELESSADPLDASILEAMHRSRTGGLVVEGTSGSTGISLATLCASRGHACLVVLPDDQAVEKQTILKTLGAVVHVVPNAAISNPNHYVNVARRLARRAVACGIKAVCTDQFENPANYAVHYTQTGPEIYRQCPDLAAFVMSSGTGGTIAGVGRSLKELTLPSLKNNSSGSGSSIKVVLVDPPGSALYHKIQHGIAFALQQRERTLKRHRYDTLAEGIGLDRVTHNLSFGLDSIDEAIQVTDQEAVDMAHWLLQAEGLWVGSSSAMNVVGAVRTARKLDKGSKVVTIICDTGSRHVTRFWNRDFILSWGLNWPRDDNRIPDCLQDVIQTNT
jgi:cysteine synthase A